VVYCHFLYSFYYVSFGLDSRVSFSRIKVVILHFTRSNFLIWLFVLLPCIPLFGKPAFTPGSSILHRPFLIIPFKILTLPLEHYNFGLAIPLLCLPLLLLTFKDYPVSHDLEQVVAALPEALPPFDVFVEPAAHLQFRPFEHELLHVFAEGTQFVFGCGLKSYVVDVLFVGQAADCGFEGGLHLPNNL
jgi:hypothetical protein